MSNVISSKLLKGLAVLSITLFFSILSFYVGFKIWRSSYARADYPWIVFPRIFSWHCLLNGFAVAGYTFLNNKVERVFSHSWMTYLVILGVASLSSFIVYSSGFLYVFLILFTFLLPLLFVDELRPVRRKWLYVLSLLIGFIFISFWTRKHSVDHNSFSSLNSSDLNAFVYMIASFGLFHFFVTISRRAIETS
jgi:hypothetical protein